MTDPAEVAGILRTLAAAYPEKQLDKPTLQLYIENLEPVPAFLLEAAVRYHIRTCKWFPKISELRQAVAILAGTHNFELIADLRPPNHGLTVRYYELDDIAFTEHSLDPAAWEALAAQFDRLDRPYMAAQTRKRLAQHQAHFSFEPEETGDGQPSD